MNVLVHCVYFPPEVGGLESHVHYLCKGLVARGHGVHVVTSRSQPGLPLRETIHGIEVERTWLPSRTPAGWLAHAICSTPATRAALAAADVVHAQAFGSILPCAVSRLGSPEKPLVTTIHTSHFLRLAEKRLLRTPLGKLLEMSDYTLAASKEIADVAEGLLGTLSVEALTNGVDTEFFRRVEPESRPTEGRRRLVVPRRLFEKNGVEYFVRALPQIVAQVDVEALLVGDGPERSHLEALAGELGVLDRIRFLGARPHAEMPALLSSGDLAVFPSLMEATSVAALESMACELPVAASDVGGLPEIVDDTVGGLFPPGNPDALAARVLDLLSASDLRERGLRARTRVVEQWSNDRLVERHLDVYASLLGRRSHG